MGNDEFKTNKKYVFTYFAKAVKYDNQLSEGFTYLGYYYSFINEEMKSIKSHLKSISINPSNEESGRVLSTYYYNCHNYEQLTELYENAINSNPRAIWAYDLYSQFTFLSENYEKSSDLLQHLCNITDNKKYWQRLGEANYYAGRYMIAESSLYEALNLTEIFKKIPNGLNHISLVDHIDIDEENCLSVLLLAQVYK